MALQTEQGTSEKKRGAFAAEEKEIRNLLEKYANAVERRSVEDIMALYASDVTAFDLMPPLQIKGKEAYRKNWSNITQMKEGHFQIRDVQVTARGDLAFSHCLCHMTGKTDQGDSFDSWCRQTACYEKINGQWLIVHENYSVPLDMKTNEPIWNLDPERTTADSH